MAVAADGDGVDLADGSCQSVGAKSGKVGVGGPGLRAVSRENAPDRVDLSCLIVMLPGVLSTNPI